MGGTLVAGNIERSSVGREVLGPKTQQVTRERGVFLSVNSKQNVLLTRFTNLFPGYII